MKYLSLDDIITINQYVVSEIGGTVGIINKTGIEEAVNRPQLSVDDYEPFPSLWEKAAVLMDSLNKNPSFASGNVGTSFIAADMMLRINHYYLICFPEDIEQIRSIAVGQLTVPHIADWLRSRSQELETSP